MKHPLRYRVLVADPPWLHDDKLPSSGKGSARAGRSASHKYATMTVEQIAAMALPPMAEDSVLFLWRVSSMVEEAYRVVRAWGFAPKSEVVWRKQTKHGERAFGMGRYVRAEHETAIIAVRGKPSLCRPKVRNVRSTFEAPYVFGPDGRIVHSGKPEEFFDLVESLYDGPYFEMFARRRRAGWSGAGDELR